jgi:ribosomal protein L11 methyltransferase
LGIRKIAAIDNDPIALEVAEKNFQLNDCRGIELHGRPLSEEAGRYDIIVSNILLETHRELMPEYAGHLVSGGGLILSGLLADQLEEIEEGLLALGMQPEKVLRADPWIAVICKMSK